MSDDTKTEEESHAGAYGSTTERMPPPLPMMITEEEGDITIRRLFELYVEELHSEALAHDQILLIRLRGLQEDTERAIERIQNTPTLAVQIVRALSLLVQELDADAGFSRAKHEDLETVRRWGLVMLAHGQHLEL